MRVEAYQACASEVQQIRMHRVTQDRGRGEGETAMSVKARLSVQLIVVNALALVACSSGDSGGADSLSPADSAREASADPRASSDPDQDRTFHDDEEMIMTGYLIDIERKTLDNTKFREVLFTGPHAQLVVMALAPGEDIGMETHADVDQFIRVEAGNGTVILDGKEHVVKDGTAVVIPAGTRHNVINGSRTEPLKLYTVYSPPEHPDGTVHQTKADAQADEREHQR